MQQKMHNSADLSRRQFLGGLAAAGVSLSFLDPALAQAINEIADSSHMTETVMAQMPTIPNPQDEQVYDSHIGNIFGPVSRIRDAYGWAGDSFAQDKYAAADYPAWQKAMREKVFEAMRYRPAETDFNVETVENIDRGAYIREKIYFNTTPEMRVPAYVLVPKDLTGKAPAIVALHDHGGFYRWGKEKLVSTDDEHPALTDFKRIYGERSIADDLAEQGYVVIVIDMFYWGERRMRLPEDPEAGPDETIEDVRRFNSARGPLEQLIARTIYSCGFTWSGLSFWDDIRTVDYLMTRPEVDPDRIGCVGLSVGGWRANHLMAFDDRVKAGVAVGWMTSFRQLQARHVINTVGFTMLLPGLYRQLDMPDVVSLSAPRALLNIIGLQDRLFPMDTGVRPAYQTLEKVYAKLGAADRFKGSFYDAPHEFNREMQAEAWEWLEKWT